MRYPAPRSDDKLSTFIEKFLKNIDQPLETPEVIAAAKEIDKKATRNKVLYRLRLLAQAGKIKGKQLSTGPWIWWIE